MAEAVAAAEGAAAAEAKGAETAAAETTSAVEEEEAEHGSVAWAGFGAVYTVEVPGTARRLVPAAKGVQDELLRRLWWRRLWDIMCQGSGDIPY